MKLVVAGLQGRGQTLYFVEANSFNLSACNSKGDNSYEKSANTVSFTKGNNCDFLFCVSTKRSRFESSLFLKERICSSRSKFLSFKNWLSLKMGQNLRDGFLLPEVGWKYVQKPVLRGLLLAMPFHVVYVSEKPRTVPFASQYIVLSIFVTKRNT